MSDYDRNVSARWGTAARTRTAEIDQGLHAPTKIPKDIKMVKEEAPPPTMSAGVAGMSGMSGGSGVPGGVMGGIGTAPPVVKQEAPKGPARVSSGVISGLKISGANPTYPPIARAAHVSGAVVLQALISKEGTIKNLRVISGPEMLRTAATEAVDGTEQVCRSHWSGERNWVRCGKPKLCERKMW